MAKIRLTKNELKNQKDDLDRFERYLPMLQLRKQQLQRQINRVHMDIDELSGKIMSFENKINSWIDVFSEGIDISRWFKIKEIVTSTGNIAGVDIPVYGETKFETEGYDLMKTPLWVDSGIEAVRNMAQLRAQMKIKKQQEETLQEEIRIATQRVNLFEQVKIPEARDNIRAISIYLGDQQTAQVIRGKIAKAKKAS